MTALTDRTDDRWDDGLIARSRPETLGLDGEHAGDENDEALVRAVSGTVSGAGSDGGKATAPPLSPEGQALRLRLDALRQLVGLSRTRLDGKTLAEAGRVLDEAAARRGLSPQHTVVA
ncbi:ATP-binding protein, partial [Streptomyces goshikiensis]